MPYRSPLSELRFHLDHVAGLSQVAATPRFAEATPDTVGAVLSEAARLCDEVLAPLNRSGDLHPAKLENGVVRTSPGFAEGYRAIAEGGWVGLSADSRWGGAGLPLTVATAVNDMMSGACLALQLNPLLTQGQIEALSRHGSPDLQTFYLPKLTSGDWSGIMALTEPQAGSDVGALTTRAEPDGNGAFRITGEKIFISWADNDFTENVSHAVLARLPGAAPGTKGISLFVVPKYLPNGDGTSGEANALRVLKLEHKMGLHGSPTAVLAYEGAKGWLVGPPHGGMACMFTMMNNARLGVGVQGIGIAEAAFQAALDWATTRRQGGAGAIVEHADVRRMLAQMKADLFAARAIALDCAVALDMAQATSDPAWAARAAVLTPIAKAFGTDVGHEVAQAGIQLHGGMGFIEETGAAQYARDVRVTSIYEGTNGIQALDLVGRKLSDGGEAVGRLLDEVEDAAARARADLPDLAGPVWRAAESLREATDWLLDHPADRGAGAAPYLRAFARVLGGRAHLRAAMAGDGARRRLAAFYARRCLPEVPGLLAQARDGAEAVLAVTPADLSS
ncbi:3-methylmercaptopropionyl-CoA dehydrogenase (DmdC) [Rubellimicrobium mesophilum DSM 19309]|uniref:3-methylmercaptopropionyl-CoA dehydrogenase (DmdC) n=1 Tax=Rubellimicrobium mesophilum DSM 19309 TaxID=442562 RepID=A0A017HRD0_9RHOB|nr:acyl-CoA dehydrogenase [Rubellimicrobium mesophilum]EYD76885.1 3-methylmercaptopropionyl-CoA dehydrogenase (DmdC) [Rubellimicrobium mesophilum DSM 19309]